MNSSSLNIVAKQNNKEIYLIEYKHKRGVGFVVDLENSIRYDDDKVQDLRKKGFWFDLYCSEKVAKHLLEKVVRLEADKN